MAEGKAPLRISLRLFAIRRSEKGIYMNYKKMRTSIFALLMVIALAITGCESADYGASLKGQLSDTAETETSTKQSEALIETETSAEQTDTLTDTETQQTETPTQTETPAQTEQQLQDSGELTVEDMLIDVGALSIPDYSGTDFYIVNDNVPFFDEALKNYSGDNFIYLSELDELERCGTCIGLFSNSTLPTEARGEIGHIKPSGWHTVKYDKSVISELYLYNRCHLLMYAVSGINDDTRNLITGTRQFNLDMLELENQVLDTLKYDESARLLYRVTPLFEGDNLVAKGVLMEAMCLGDEEGLSFCMFIYNVQDGIVIDYATGESALAQEAKNGTIAVTETSGASAEENTQQTGDAGGQPGTDYVVNTNSGKFHYTWCSSVEKIKAQNRMDFNGTRDELIDMGYEPCGKCEP